MTIRSEVPQVHEDSKFDLQDPYRIAQSAVAASSATQPKGSKRGSILFLLLVLPIYIVGIHWLLFTPIEGGFTWPVDPPSEASVPFDCALARGTAFEDYRPGVIPGPDGTLIKHCWYSLSRFRDKFPEYADMGDEVLVSTLSDRAGVPPMEIYSYGDVLFRRIVFRFPVSLLALVVGALLVWAAARVVKPSRSTARASNAA